MYLEIIEIDEKIIKVTKLMNSIEERNSDYFESKTYQKHRNKLNSLYAKKAELLGKEFVIVE